MQIQFYLLYRKVFLLEKTQASQISKTSVYENPGS